MRWLLMQAGHALRVLEHNRQRGEATGQLAGSGRPEGEHRDRRPDDVGGGAASFE